MGLNLYREDVLQVLAYTCKRLGIDREHILIGHGAAAVILGLQSTTDVVDVEVLDFNAWHERIAHTTIGIDFLPALGMMGACEVFNQGNINFHWMGTNKQSPIDKHVGCVRGFLVTTEVRLFEDKIKLGRDKDLATIRKLKGLLEYISPELQNRFHQLMDKLK